MNTSPGWQQNPETSAALPFFVPRSPPDGCGPFAGLDNHVLSSVGPRPSADGGPAD